METKKFNLVEILKDCPRGTTLYSPILGVVNFEIDDISDKFGQIIVISTLGAHVHLNKDGQFCDEGELMLFPSKDNRDWSTFKVPKKEVERFDPKTLKTFDKVLVRYSSGKEWYAAFFSHVKHGLPFQYTVTPYVAFSHIIPYKDNEHLVGKVEEPEEYYRYWEDEISKEDG